MSYNSIYGFPTGYVDFLYYYLKSNGKMKADEDIIALNKQFYPADFHIRLAQQQLITPLNVDVPVSSIEYVLIQKD